MASRKGKPARISDKKRAEIVHDVRTSNDSQRVIAKRHGVSASSVRTFAAEAGIEDPFDRTATEKATHARAVDLAAMRAELAKLLIEDAYELRDRARSEYRYYERGMEGPELVSLPRPPLRETREAYTALGIAIDKSKHLLQQDSGAGGAAAVDAWLRDMIGDAALSAAAQNS